MDVLWFSLVSLAAITVGFSIHGRHARIFGHIFDQISDHICDRGFWPGSLNRKYSFAVLLGLRHTMYSITGTEKYSVQYYPDRENKLFTIYYSKSKTTSVRVLYWDKSIPLELNN